jgi:hypothetical protein
MADQKIKNAADLRAILLLTMEGVLEGRVNVPMANAVVGLSGEVHKSIRQEWDMRVYAAENFCLESGKVIKLLEGEHEDKKRPDSKKPSP